MSLEVIAMASWSAFIIRAEAMRDCLVADDGGILGGSAVTCEVVGCEGEVKRNQRGGKTRTRGLQGGSGEGGTKKASRGTGGPGQRE